jgi:hypothetical protein
MATKESKELTKPATTALAEMPDYFDAGDRTGLEHIGKDDMQMPRLAIAQALSPQLKEDDPKYIDGLKFGHLFNDVTGENFQRGPIEFMVVRADPTRWIEFNPREAGGGIKDFHVPFGDPRTQFGANGEKPAAMQFYDFIVLMLPTRTPIALSFKSSGLKVAKRLNTLIAMRNAPLFAGRYTLTAAKEKNQKGEFAVYQIKNSEVVDEFSAQGKNGPMAGWVNRELFDYAKSLHEQIKDKKIDINREVGDEDDANAGAADRVSNEDVPF